jgi:hypothetical protein
MKLPERVRSLRCHGDDCVMNVLSFLDIIDRSTAFQLANVTDRIIIETVLNFLNETYGVPHTLYEIYNDDDYELSGIPSPEVIYENLEYAQTFLDSKLRENNTVLMAIFYGRTNHMATIGKLGNQYFFIDPQSAKQIKFFSEEMAYYMYSQKFHKIEIIESPPPIKFEPNLPKLKRRLDFEATKDRIRQYGILQPGLQHRITPGERYQIFGKNGTRNTNSLISVSNYHARFRKKTLDPIQNYYFKHVPKVGSVKKTKSLNRSKTRTRSSKIRSI